jgi:UDP-glucuronate decarboxylase
MARPIETIRAAVDGTQRLLEMATQCSMLEGFLFLSSSEVYGDPDPSAVPTKESYNGNVSTTGPRACYDESKRLGETLCSVYNRLYGVPTKIVRPFNVYGPGLIPGDSRIVPTFTFQVLNNRPMTVFGSGLQTRSYCHVDDAIFGFIAALLDGRSGEPYNIGNPDDEMSAKSLAELFSELHQPSSYELVDYPDTYPSGEASRRCPDITKASSELGFSATVSLRQDFLTSSIGQRANPCTELLEVIEQNFNRKKHNNCSQF